MLDLYINIRNRRKELGMSQEELAKKVGYTSRSTIARIEKGEIDISRAKIFAFAEALKTSPSELMGLSGFEEEVSVKSTYVFENPSDILVKLSDDSELLALVERAETDDSFRERLLQISQLLESK